MAKAKGQESKAKKAGEPKSKRKKSWQEKLATDKDLPKVFVIPPEAELKFGKGKMVVAAPREVDELMQRVRSGKLVTTSEIRAALAAKHHADTACPLTTGIFCWISAHAANESEEKGKASATPYWRTLKSGGELNPKYPGGIESQKVRLSSEGHRVIQRGKRFFVDNFEAAIQVLTPNKVKRNAAQSTKSKK